MKLWGSSFILYVASTPRRKVSATRIKGLSQTYLYKAHLVQLPWLHLEVWHDKSASPAPVIFWMGRGGEKSGLVSLLVLPSWAQL